MQPVSQEYKELMRRKWINPLAYVRITIGMINQKAQETAYIGDKEHYTYYSNLTRPMDNYQVQELYATCDQDYTGVDGRMYFLPRDQESVVLNQGVVSMDILGSIEIRFPIKHDIKGLTIEFGKAYPVDFSIVSDNNTVEITGNTTSHFVTDEVFDGVTFLRFVPAAMVNGQSRFRIHMITMGVGIYFDNRSIYTAIKKEHISPIMEELPTIDVSVTVNNRDRTYDIENSESSINFLEIGQNVELLFGQAMDSGQIEWIPGAVLQLKEWSADDEKMSFTATDRFDGMDGIYYRGVYQPDGISLYDLAVDVLTDAGVDTRTYWLDSYLRRVKVCNPLPVVSHKEALQLIANAGRCILCQDRTGNIFIRSSFVPDMTASSHNETYYSHAGAVLEAAERMSYATAAQNYTDVTPTQYFLPRQDAEEAYLNTGYISAGVAGEDGAFQDNPAVEITLEARYKCFGMTLEFGRNNPYEMVFHTYLADELQEDYTVSGLTQTTVIYHEFPEFDRLVLEFTRGLPNNRVILNNITFGDRTDYVLEYGHELTETPKGTQLAKVRELQMVRTMYSKGGERKELARETIAATAADNRYTFYFSSPAYDLSCTLTESQEGQKAVIIDSSNYYATVEITGATGPCEMSVTGCEYIVTRARVSRQLNPAGSLETWENPLVSDTAHAADMADWIGNYLKSDREYDLQYRGEPRLDANDIAFLENKYVEDLLLRVCDHTLKFSGGFSGTIKARRDMDDVATAKNRLAAR